MRKSTALLLTIVAAMVAIAVPMLYSIHLAKEEALESEKTTALAFATDALGRSDLTSDQLREAVDSLIARRRGDPCSPESVALMRAIDLASSNLQAIGYVSGNRLLCSSVGPAFDGTDLGPVNVDQPGGTRLRLAVVLPEVPGSRFLVVEYKRYAAIVHKFIPIDVARALPGVGIAIVNSSDGQVLTSRGPIKYQRVALQPGQVRTFVDDTDVVAAIASQRNHVTAIATVPTSQLKERVRRAALMTVPIGFFAGLILAIIVFYIARLQMAFPSVLRTALKRDEFFLAYQPVVHLCTGKWVGAEALIRWRRPDGEVVRPDDFIPAAEDAGLIVQITERVVELVARDAKALFQRYPDFHVAINLSSADLHDDFTVSMLRRLAQESGAAPGNLMVEATERGFTDPGSAGKVIRELRAHGFRVAIDDFGTGYSSLSYLESFELDLLKIDKSFVHSIGTTGGKVVLQIIEMAKVLKLEMIAEGVTTREQADFLCVRDVQYAQGWLFAQPMKIDELLAMLAQLEQESAVRS